MFKSRSACLAAARGSWELFEDMVNVTDLEYRFYVLEVDKRDFGEVREILQVYEVDIATYIIRQVVLM